MRNFRYFGEITVCLGVVFWSLNAPLIKFTQIDSMFVCGIRSLIAGLALLPFLRMRRLNWNRWMAVYLISFAGLSITIVFSLRLTDSAIAVGMQYTALIWLSLIELLQGKQMTWYKGIPVGMILIGIIIFMSTGIKSGSIFGGLIALSEGVFFAGMTLSSKKVSGTNPIGLTALANLVTGCAVSLFLLPQIRDIIAFTPLDWLIMIVLGIVQIGCGHAFYNWGLQYIAAKKAAIFALGEMILGPLWVALFLGEYPAYTVLIGLGMILFGMILGIYWEK